MGNRLSKSSSEKISENSEFSYSTSYNKSILPLFYQLTSKEWKIKSRKHSFSNSPIDLASFLKEHSDINWKHAECTINGIRAYYPDSRLVFKCQDNIGFSSSLLDIFTQRNNLGIVGEVDFLKYETGCFASKHIDRMGEYTCLLFPKGSNSTGGELILYVNPEMNEIITFRPYSIEHDTIIIFPTGMEHEVLPVISGERYVFKVGLASIPKPIEHEIIFHENPNTELRIFKNKFSCNMD
jgi:hypothetical protein